MVKLEGYDDTGRLHVHKPQVEVDRITFVFRVRKIPRSSLVSETGYPELSFT
jgi:hypothetical protein